jgi:hypothetical protein
MSLHCVQQSLALGSVLVVEVVVVMRKLNNSKGMIVDKRGSRALTESGTPEIGDSQPSVPQRRFRVFSCTQF